MRAVRLDILHHHRLRQVRIRMGMMMMMMITLNRARREIERDSVLYPLTVLVRAPRVEGFLLLLQRSRASLFKAL